jgi:predicted SAM-dependent methyltransferase
MQLISIADVTIDERKQATRYLRGAGIEIGASHMPIEVDKTCCQVRYVDRLGEVQIDEKFPELKESQLVPVDVICDVVAEGLAPFEEGSLDFVIASHLLEHVPNPLGFIKECHRVLRYGGVLYLGVPDKNFTFDRDRDRTPLHHVVQDFKNDVRTIDEEHLIDYLVKAAKETIPDDPGERVKLFDRELGRSFHVHVWTWEDIIELLTYMIKDAGVAWELLELYLPKGLKNEVICILQKTDVDAETAARRFASSVLLLVARERATEELIRQASRAQSESGGHRKTVLARIRGRLSPPKTL